MVFALRAQRIGSRGNGFILQSYHSVTVSDR